MLAGVFHPPLVLVPLSLTARSLSVRGASTSAPPRPLLHTPYLTDFSCSKAFATKDKLKRHALSHARRKAGLSVSVGSAARREADTRQNAALFAEKAAAAGVSLQPGPATSSGNPLLPYTSTTAPLLEASRMERQRALSDSGNGSSTGSGWKHSCPHCGRNFLDNYHLKRHIKAIHEGPRPYRCDHPVVSESSRATSSSVAAGTAVDTAAVAAAAPAIPNSPGGGVNFDPGTKKTRQGGVGVVREREGAAKEAKGAGSSEGGEGGAAEAEAETEQQGRVHGVCGAAFAKKWQLREHLYAEHGQTK